MNKFRDSVDHLLTKLLVKTTTLEEAYGNKLKKLSPIAPETIDTPEATKIPFGPRHKYLQQETYTTPPIYTTTLEDVLYSPDYNVLLTKNRRIISDSIIVGRMDVNSKEFNWRNIFSLKVKKISGVSSIFRGTPKEYYHALIDNIPRAYLLNQPEYQDIEEIKLLCPEPLYEVESFLLPKITPDNVTMHPVSGGTLYYLEKVIFPSFLATEGTGYLPTPYLEKLFAEVLPKRPRNKKNRIYISRSKSAIGKHKRHIINEEELLQELGKLGFQKYVLENMSLAEKIDLFYDAETVIGAEGAGLAHVLFSEQVNLLMLCPRQCMNAHMYFLSKPFEHRFRYLLGDGRHHFSNFRVDIAKVLDLLSSFQIHQEVANNESTSLT